RTGGAAAGAGTRAVTLVHRPARSRPRGAAAARRRRGARPRPAGVLREGLAAAAARHLAPPDADPVAAVAAVRALRRRELFRIAAADVLATAGDLAPAQTVDVVGVGRALSDVTDATLAAALAAARATAPAGISLAVIGLGRLGGGEMSYPSDADVLFVYEPADGWDDEAAGAAAHAVAPRLRSLLAA